MLGAPPAAVRHRHASRRAARSFKNIQYDSAVYMTVAYHEIAVASLSKIPGPEATKQESWHFSGDFVLFRPPVFSIVKRQKLRGAREYSGACTVSGSFLLK